MVVDRVIDEMTTGTDHASERSNFAKRRSESTNCGSLVMSLAPPAVPLQTLVPAPSYAVVTFHAALREVVVLTGTFCTVPPMRLMTAPRDFHDGRHARFDRAWSIMPA